MLSFIGCGSAFNTELGNNGAFIKNNNELFLIDCGSNAFDRLLKGKVLEGIDKIHVLITHPHPDHIGSLGDLIFYSYYYVGKVREVNLTVYAPSVINIKACMNMMGVDTSKYHLNEFYSSTNLYNKDTFVHFKPIPVEHTSTLKGKCVGYLLNVDNLTIYYSGDCSEIPENILEMLYQGEIDYFYQDTSKAHYDGNPHLSLENLTKLITKEWRDRVYCMHLDKTFDKKEAETLGFHIVSPIPFD